MDEADLLSESLKDPDCNSRKVVENLLQKITLKQLLETHNENKLEMLDLSRNMRELLYENYTHFIASADSIEFIRESLASEEHLESGLRKFTKEIEKEKVELRNVFRSEAENFEEIFEINELLKHLTPVLESRDRMKNFVLQSQFLDAMDVYQDYSEFLKSHADVNEFNVILVDLEELKNEVIFKIENELRYGDSVLEDYPRKYIKQHETETLKLYFSSVEKQFLRDLEKLKEDSLPNDDCITDQCVQSMMCRLEARHLVSLSELICVLESLEMDTEFTEHLASISFQETTDIGRRTTTTTTGQTFVLKLLSYLFECVENFVENNPPSSMTLVDCANTLRRRLKDFIPYLSKSLAPMFTTSMKNLVCRCYASVIQACSFRLIKRIEDCCQSANDVATLEQVAHEFSKLEHEIMTQLCLKFADAHQSAVQIFVSDPATYETLTADLLALSTLYIEAFASFAIVYGGREPEEADPLLTSIAPLPLPHLTAAALAVKTPILSAASVAANRVKWDLRVSLGLVRICRRMELKGLAKLRPVLAEQLDSHLDSLNDILNLWYDTVASHISVGCQTLLAFTCFIVGTDIANDFRSLLQKGKNPSEAYNELTASLESFSYKISSTLGSDFQHSNSSSSRNSKQRSQAEEDMERLMARRLPLYGPVPINARSAVVATARAVLKASLELIRDIPVSSLEREVGCGIIKELGSEKSKWRVYTATSSDAENEFAFRATLLEIEFALKENEVQSQMAH